jgi:hypothetical protein
VDREHGIEEMREADAVRFSDQTKERAVAVEAPWASGLDDLETRLVVPIEDLVRYPAARPAIHERQGVRAVPLHADDGYQCVRQDATNGGVGLEIFEFQ